MLFKQTSIIGSAHHDPADIIDIVKLVADGKVKPRSETYSIDEINCALRLPGPDLECQAAGPQIGRS